MDRNAHRFLLRHGFTAAIPAVTCHGYANGCRCSECRERVALIAEHRAAGRAPFLASGAVRPLGAVIPPQPWEAAA